MSTNTFEVTTLNTAPQLLRDETFIVKLGGALISDKDAYCTPNVSAIRDYAELIRSCWSEVCGRLVVVLGGGSYGNAVPFRYRLQDSSNDWQPADLQMMTVKTLEFMSLVTDIFRQSKVPCYPFQTCSYLSTADGRPEKVFLDPISHALSLGVLPILSGDLVFDSTRGFVIFSSDNIPELFVGRLPIKRVVMLTNVPGVMSYSSAKPELIREVTDQNRDEVLRHAGPSQQQDVSGGMNNKVRALLRLADLGVESAICDGREPANLLRGLFDSVPPGTLIQSSGNKEN